MDSLWTPAQRNPSPTLFIIGYRTCPPPLLPPLTQAAREDPNTIIRLSREEPWSKEHSTIMGPENSYFYFGAEDRPGFIVYGNNQVRIPMTYFLRPGRKETSTYVSPPPSSMTPRFCIRVIRQLTTSLRSRYFRCQNGKDFKWKAISTHRMEVSDYPVK